MKSLERESLNESDEKTRDFMERVEMKFLKLRGSKIEIFAKLG